jgi:hypothetical protein
MIVWLASYPRSGNTLLRTILRQTMGLHSLPERTEWERVMQTGTPPGETEQFYGEIHPDRSWDEFYHMAKSSTEVHLVKTHEPPMDDQPAIYVVRNGRKAIYSYLKYHQAHLPRLGRELFEIVTGHDYYGDWTSHYRAWNRGTGDGPRLVVRYEELCSATPALLHHLADFVGHQSEPRAWKNPFATLHQQQPDVFREGRTDWKRPEEWGRDIEWLFSVFHDELMAELGYEEKPMEAHDVVWMDWYDRAAGRVLNLLDHGDAVTWAVQRNEAETARIRARLVV